jgi:plasmid stabilization system protein ParE
MKYTVILTKRAEAELQRAYVWLLERTPQHAAEWYNGAIEAMVSLEEMPARFPLAPESRPSSKELRQMMYGDKNHGYRFIFVVEEDEVRIFSVRHAARRD